MDTDLLTPGSGPHWSTQPWPCQGKQSQPSKSSVHATWRFSLQGLTFLFVPQEAGPGLCASWRWHAGSARVLSEQRARLCQLPLCQGAAQLDACPCTDASGTPARNANAEGSRKEELGTGCSPCQSGWRLHTSRCQLTSPPGLGGSSMEERASSSRAAAAQLCSLVLDFGPFGF